MQILGDTNATFKDLTRIFEAEIMEADEPLYPKICSDVESADEAYIKIPVQTKVDFPVLFDGENIDTSTEVNIIQTYNKATYALTLEYNSDLIRESKVFTFSDKTQEAAMSSKIFPSYNLTKNVIGANPKAYDGQNFYSATHKYANAGKNNINNLVTQTGTNPAALYADLQTAVATMRTFLDDKGRLLNPNLRYGANQLVIHCPVALEIAFRQVVFGSMIPQVGATTSPTVSGSTAGTTSVTGNGPRELGLSGIANIVSDGYLDTLNANTWYLHYVGAPQRPFVYSQSYGVTAVALGLGSEHETKTGKVVIKAKQRFVEGVYRFDRSIKIG